MTSTARIEAADPTIAFGDELPPGTLLCGGQYTIERYLASGGFGITYLARDSLDRKVVIKECFPGAMCHRTNATVRLRSKGNAPEFDQIIELFEKEARALASLQHPYIVGVHQIFHDNGTAYMALDFVPGRDLMQVIQHQPNRLGPVEIRQILAKVLDAVAYMHDRDILHRDISPDNILLEDDNTPVLIDFGAARESATRVSRVLSKVLTVKDGYSPQEFYLAGSEQPFSGDLYALAATFYHLVSGKAPPSSQVRLAAAAKQLKDPLEPLPQSYGYDRHFIDAINRCLSIFPKERIQSAAEWRELIDVDRRREKLREQAERDRDMERRVAEMVRAWKRDVAAAGGSLPQPARKAATEAAPRPDPRAEAEARRWAILREPPPAPPEEAAPSGDDAAQAGDAAAAEAPRAGARRGLLGALPLLRRRGGSLKGGNR